MGTDGEIRLQETDAWPVLDAPPALEQSTDIALRQRPDLQAMEHDWQRERGGAASGAGRLPAVARESSGQYDLNSENFSQAGGQLRGVRRREVERVRRTRDHGQDARSGGTGGAQPPAA